MYYVDVLMEYVQDSSLNGLACCWHGRDPLGLASLRH